MNTLQKTYKIKYSKILGLRRLILDGRQRYRDNTIRIAHGKGQMDIRIEVLIDSAMNLIKSKNYKYAYQLLEKYNTTEQIFNLLKGHAYFLDKNYPSALYYYDRIPNNKLLVFFDEKEYFTLFCYLNEFGKYKENFKNLSTQIRNDKNHHYYFETLELIYRLKILEKSTGAKLISE